MVLESKSMLRKKPAYGVALSLLLVFILSSLIKAHHESLPAPERWYLKLISLHPFKDKLISQDGYDFFITVAESAPDTFDIIFYIENSLFKRAVHSPKEILIYHKDTPRCSDTGHSVFPPRRDIGAEIPDKFILKSDIAGVSNLKYFAHKPFEARIKVSATTSDNKPISTETDIQIGSPSPSIIFIITFMFIILVAIISVYLTQRAHRKTNDEQLITND